MSINISVLQKQIGIIFTSKKILLKSLTHKSSNAKDNNEKLEFLGDRVLGLIISKKLLELFPNDKEGVLDKKLASLVNRKKCVEVSKNFNLESYLITGNFKSSKNKKIEDKIISDACEALIGAIYLDQGLDIAEKFSCEINNADSMQRYKCNFGILHHVNVPHCKKAIYMISTKAINDNSSLGVIH